MLSDGEKRKAYDTYGHAGLGGGGGGGGPGQGFGQGFHPGGGGFQWRSDNPNVDLNDIFEQLFGGQGRRQRGPRRGRDVQTQIVLDLEEVSETLPSHSRESSERVPRDCAARETWREMCHAVCHPLLPHPHTLCQAKSPATSPATHLTTTPPHHHHGHHRHTATPPPHDTVHTTRAPAGRGGSREVGLVADGRGDGDGRGAALPMREMRPRTRAGTRGGTCSAAFSLCCSRMRCMIQPSPPRDALTRRS